MAYLPDFKNDIFISYARVDDEPLNKGDEGWISRFHRSLEVLLHRRLGADPAIWRDVAELRGNDYLGDKLETQSGNAAILISVISPGYLNSKWCLRELREFCEMAEVKGNLRVAEDKARIFKVLPHPLPLEEHPPEVKDFLGYEFFKIDVVTNKPVDFDPVLGEEASQKYLAKVTDLVWDIVQLFKLLKQDRGGRQAAPAGPAVYLAEVSSDQASARDTVRRELQERGCLVLPTKHVVSGPDFMHADVRGDLDRAQLSIHIIGENYGMIPEKSERSVVDLQNELAAQRATDRAFTRVVWLPAGLAPQDPRQKEFIARLKNDPAMHENVEFLEGSIEELKTCIERRLSALREAPAPAPMAAAPEQGPRRIYVICDPQDLNAVAPIRDYLFNQGFEPIVPLTEGTETEMREDHKDNLITCDAALIYQGAASESWLRTKQSDLKKAAGFGRVRPMLARAIFLGAPETALKQSFRTLEASVIKNFGPVSPAALAPFISKLGGSQPA